MVQKVMNKVRPHVIVDCEGMRCGPPRFAWTSGRKGMETGHHHDLIAERMQLPCMCSPTNRHVPCEGKLTRESAYYTDMFAKRVVSALRHGCSHSSLMQELLQPLKLSELRRPSGEEKVRTGEENQNVQEKAGICECELISHPKCDVCCAACEQAKDRATSMCLVGEGDVQPLSDQKKDRALRRIGSLHRATGHAPVQHVVQALVRKGTDPRVVELARAFRCPVCEESKPRVSRRAATLEPLPQMVSGASGQWVLESSIFWSQSSVHHDD